MRMAFLSSDGLNIDLNLEDASNFVVVDYSSDENIKVEGQYNRKEELHSLLADCSVIFCRKAGEDAKAFFIQRGFELVESMGYIPQVVHKYLSDRVEKDFSIKLLRLQEKTMNKN